MPPCSSQPPFVVVPMVADFSFRVLRQNRRVVSDESRRAELETFHEVLTDISLGNETNSVRKFLVEAYVRGAKLGRAEDVNFEGSTAVFTKRRYRDKYNRTMVRRIAKKTNHTIKIHAKVRARGCRQNWYSNQKVQFIRKKARTQSLWNLQLAGDWHYSHETLPTGSRLPPPINM